MKSSHYSHCAGDEEVPVTLQEEIAHAIRSVTVRPTKKVAPKLRKAIIDALQAAGWSDEVPVARNSDITITSTKSDVGLCCQTGNMARMYADLIKLQTLYLNGAINAAIIILPSQPLAKLMGDNIAQAQRLGKELRIFKKAYNVPTLVFALE